MRIVVLGSGSQGNSVVVESGGRRLLVDAGFSAKEITRRLALRGLEPEGLDAIVVTHEHEDHSRGVDVLARRHRLPVFATRGTWDALEPSEKLSGFVHVCRSGRPFEVAGFEVEPFGIPHDAREPIGLTITNGAGRRVGLVADLGCRSRLAWARLRDLDALILEANHDLGMLRRGPYPWSLKQRVAGRFGHLSNEEAAEGLPELIGDALGWVILYHLSRTNNLPALAEAVVGEVLDRARSTARLVVADQADPSPWIEIS